MTTLRIVTAFHGAVIHSNAFQDPELYVPVYGGRANTLYLPDQSKMMLADNTGDNISWMNPYVGELTCIYWASKNLDKLGKPDYIGLNHYRRLFPIRKHLEGLMKQEKPFIMTTSRQTGIPVIALAELEYGIQNELVSLFDEIIPTEDKKLAMSFLQQKEYAEKNLFIMPTEELSDYINFIMTAIHALFRDFKFEYFQGMQYKRLTARLLEYVTAYYLYKLSMTKYMRLTIDYEYPWRQFA